MNLIGKNPSTCLDHLISILYDEGQARKLHRRKITSSEISIDGKDDFISCVSKGYPSSNLACLVKLISYLLFHIWLSLTNHACIFNCKQLSPWMHLKDIYDSTFQYFNVSWEMYKKSEVNHFNPNHPKITIVCYKGHKEVYIHLSLSFTPFISRALQLPSQNIITKLSLIF